MNDCQMLERRQIARLVLQNALKQPGCFDDATGAMELNRLGQSGLS